MTNNKTTMTNNKTTSTNQLTIDLLRNKPKTDYTFEDWRTLYIDASYREALNEVKQCIDGMTGLANDDWEIACLKTSRACLMTAFSKGRGAAIAMCDEITDSYGTSEDPRLMECCANALRNKGYILAKQRAYESAISVLDDMIAKYKDHKDSKIIALVLAALNDKARIVQKSPNSGNAIDIYDDIISRYDAYSDPDIAREVARAMMQKGIALLSHGETLSAIAVYDAMILKYTSCDSDDVASNVNLALHEKASARFREKEYQFVVHFWDQMLGRYGNCKATYIDNLIADAFIRKAEILLVMGLPTESVGVFDVIMARLDDYKKEAFIARAINALCIDLDLYSQTINICWDDVIVAIDEILLRYSEFEDAEVVAALTRILYTKASILCKNGQIENAIDVLDSVVTRYGVRHELGIIAMVGMALARHLKCLCDIDRDLEPAIARCQSFIERYSSQSQSEAIFGLNAVQEALDSLNSTDCMS